jgi:hypothetical protein
VAKSHKKAGRMIQVSSTLAADQLASLCKEAADRCKLQLDEVDQGLLVFSVRGAITSKIHLMTFEVQLSSGDGGQTMTSRIRHYKTTQQRLFYFVPIAPRRMLGLSAYEKFMRNFGELTRQADPHASVTIAG